MEFKLARLQELYEVCGDTDLASRGLPRVFDTNRHWLEPHAAFVTSATNTNLPFRKLETNNTHNPEAIAKLFAVKSPVRKELLFLLFCSIPPPPAVAGSGGLCPPQRNCAEGIFPLASTAMAVMPG